MKDLEGLQLLEKVNIGKLWVQNKEATNEVNLGFEVAGTIIERPVYKGDSVYPLIKITPF